MGRVGVERLELVRVGVHVVELELVPAELVVACSAYCQSGVRIADAMAVLEQHLAALEGRRRRGDVEQRGPVGGDQRRRRR